MDEKLAARTWTEIRDRVKGFGIPLSDRDLDTINEIYQAFSQAGMEVRYTIRDRPSNRFFPPYRDLLMETDLEGHRHNYFATEADFQFIKQMQERNLIIPVTGDLSGDHAVRAIGQYLAETGERVSAFYTSNVEYYLMRQNSFDRFAENLKALPIDQRSVIIRSYFNYSYYASPHPQTIENYFSVQAPANDGEFAQGSDGGRLQWRLFRPGHAAKLGSEIAARHQLGMTKRAG